MNYFKAWDRFAFKLEYALYYSFRFLLSVNFDNKFNLIAFCAEFMFAAPKCNKNSVKFLSVYDLTINIPLISIISRTPFFRASISLFKILEACVYTFSLRINQNDGDNPARLRTIAVILFQRSEKFHNLSPMRFALPGFFTTDSNISPGNYGLKDVLMALRWVHENIKSFHGDPNSVTLWGHSSGAGLVHALALSKKTEGLFHRYIMQSGTLFASAGKNSYYKMRSVSLEIAKLLGCLPRRTENDTGTATDSVVNENSTMQPKKIAVRASRGVVEEEDYSEEEEEEMMRCMRSISRRKEDCPSR